MKEKIISIAIIAVLAVIAVACNDKETAEEPGNNGVREGTAEEGTITGLPGRLSYYPDYQMWGIEYVYPGSIDAIDIYLIKDGIDGELPVYTSVSVTFSGDYSLTELRYHIATSTVYYLTNLKYKTEEDFTGEGRPVSGLTGRLSYYLSYQMWGIEYAYPGSIDAVDIYLIKDGIDDELPVYTSVPVTFSGDSYPTNIWLPWAAGTTVYYLSNLKYEQEGLPEGYPMGEGTHIAELTGRLFYSSYYKMWVAEYAYPGTIDSVDYYLIIDGIDDLPTDATISVTYSGDYYPSGIESAVAGRTIYYITNFKYKKI
ncbi:MAG: hypothetical protein LBK65_00760 [Tannerellaceae bacterium]|nr:hypothetical protein [Tannerellaceae bacterium]